MQLPDFTYMTNEQIVELFESFEEPPIELIRKAYIARDLVMFGNDTENTKHQNNRTQLINKFRFYFHENEQTLQTLLIASGRGDLVQFYNCLDHEQLVVLGW